MTENIKARWLTDNEQIKIAPKTLVTQILNEDGTRFKKTFEDSVNNINTAIDETNRTIRNHTNDTDIHVTAEEKEAWSNIEIPSLEGYATEEYVESMVKSLNSNLALSFYCVEDVTVITNGVSETFPANSTVELKFLDTDVFEIVPTSNNSILSLTSFPGALGTFYPWLEGVRQFSNILFDMNSEDMYIKWSQGQQGMYNVQSAQYLNCIFWSDNPYINDVTKRTNYTLTHSSQLPLCYSSIPDNTFKAFYLADGVISDPNWANQAYLDSFAKATWATQVFSYYGARTIGRPELFVITLPKDCRGLMFYARNVENAGIFDATNVTNFGAKSGSWREAFGNCSALRRLYISNLKVNLNISWSPVDYDSIYYIISNAANTSAITISVSPYTYYLLRDADFNLAASKNITIALLTSNYVEDKRFSTVAYTTGDGEFTGDVIAGGNGGSSPVSLKSVNNLVQNKADQNAVLLKTEQSLTDEEITQVHSNLKMVGQDVTGTEYTIDGSTVAAGTFAEVFNNYEENIAAGKYSHAEGYQTTAKGSYSHAEGYGTYATAAATHAEGYDTHATARYAHAEGASTTASGNNSHAEGNSTTAAGHYSHAEGNFTTATGAYSHAEGNYAQTGEDGTYAHAEGSYTQATKTGAHAEGNYTEANAAFAHTEGYYTKANSAYQHVRGKYNIADDTGTYATIIGNGDADSNRKNIHTLDWNGNAWFEGDIYVGSTGGINKDEGSKKLATEEYADAKIENISLESLGVYSKTEVDFLLSHNMSNKTIQSVDVINTRIDNLFLETTEEEILSIFTE